MALSASTIFECQSAATASNVNGGGFNTANANFLTDGAATSATGNSPVFTSVSYNFVAGDVGHWIYIKSGTNWTAGWYQIASVAANAATLSAAIGQGIQVTNNLYATQTAAGCATTASPTGATWGLDYSQSTASPFASTDLASTNGTTNPATITSVANPFGVQMVGNLIHITAGTNWTQGWYEIVSVSVITATLDRAVGSAATLTSGTGKVGGALSLASSDDAVFELAVSSATASARFFVKGNATYTIGGTVSIAANGNAAWPIIIEGYATTRGDRPTGSTRPIFSCGAVNFTLGNDWDTISMAFTGTSSGTVLHGTSCKALWCKFSDTSSTSNRIAVQAGTNSYFFACEIICYRGRGIAASSNSLQVFGCYIHNCDVGIGTSGSGGFILFNIFENFITTAINWSSAASGFALVCNNTVYGAENKLGTGLNLVTGSTNVRVVDNIFYGLVTGVTHADTNAIGFDDYNNYYNNTNDVSAAGQWQKGTHDLAVNPSFTSVAQVTGTTGKFAAGNSILIDTTQNFTTAGVIAGQDYLYISSGTGITNSGMWVGITSISTTTNPNDTLNLDTAQGTNTTADKVYQITTGHNFNVGTNLKALGFPGAFPAALTTGYLDIGAVQRQESASGGMIQSRVFTGY